MTPFDIVLVPFPFADLSTSKRRPCLVLSSFKPRAMHEHLVVCMMTSQIQGARFPFDIEVKSFKAAGLPKPTLIRVCKIVTIDSSLVIKKLGRLEIKDQRSVQREIRGLFKTLCASELY